jgi:GT2 family glycosyltransferase
MLRRTLADFSLPCSNHYKNSTSPYYLVAPNYSAKSAGIRLLHEMCSLLNQLGYESYVHADGCNGELWTPKLTEDVKLGHFQARKTPIVVYPEVVKGLPLNIGVPVRYVLNVPGLLGQGDKAYSERELIFTYMKEYYPDGRLLLLPVINLTQLDAVEPRRPRIKGSRAVYYNRVTPDPEVLRELGEDCIDVSTKITFKPGELFSILKSVEVLYTFENSAITGEALLCGCAVVGIRNDEFQSAHESLIKLAGDAFTWSRDRPSLDRAVAAVAAVRNAYELQYAGWWDQLQNFITITQAAAHDLGFESAWPQEAVDQLPLASRTTAELGAMRDRQKYLRVNTNYLEWRAKSTLREIDADIYAEHIAHKGLPKVGLVVHQNATTKLEELADTLDSIEQNFLKPETVWIVSLDPPPAEFAETGVLRWMRKDQLASCGNDALGSLDWMLVVQAGVKLAPQALVELAIEAGQHPQSALLYADDDIVSGKDAHAFPNFKPGFNIELIRCTNYIGGNVLFNTNAWRRAQFPVAEHEIYHYLVEASLHAGSRSGSEGIRHLEGVLFHGTGQGAAAAENLEFSSADAVLKQGGLVRSLRPLDRIGAWLVDYAPVIPKNTTLVVPTGVQTGYMRQMLESLAKHGCDQLAKVVLVCDQSHIEEVDFALEDLEFPAPILRVSYSGSTYNHGLALNTGIAAVQTEYVWVCDDDVEFIQQDALGILLSVAQQEDVACVEPRMLSTDGKDAKLVGGPVVLGMRGSAGCYTGEQQLPEEYGYFSRLQLTQDVGAVSGHCFVCKTKDWAKLGGFDTVKFGVKHSVLDFCLRLNRLGKRHVWAPLANVIHLGGKTLFKQMQSFEFKLHFVNQEQKEREQLLLDWGQELAHDVYYNRHLSLLSPYDVESNIVIDWNPYRHDRPKVLACPLKSGAGQYRVIEPLEMLQDQGRVQSSVIMPMANGQTRVLQPLELIRAQPDTLILQHSVDDAQLSLIDQYKQSLPGLHIVQMVDDLLGFVPKKHPGQRFQSREGHQRMSEALKKSDAMVVTTLPLLEHYQKYVPNVSIIPNCLSSKWFALQPVKTKNKRLRVGWIGAGQHQGDLEIINDVVAALSDRVDWVFMGMHTEQAKTHIKEFHPFVSIKDYAEKMASLNLDVAVAPLEDHVFNQCKSNLRLLEYGAMSWPVVCSDVYPYQTNNPPVLRCKPDFHLWMAALERLIDDQDLRLEMGRKLHAWVRQHHSLDNWGGAWFSSLIPSAPQDR